MRVAFWAKPTEDGKWFLYLASPIVDRKGRPRPTAKSFRIMRTMPDLWIDPLEIRVVGVDDSFAQAGLERDPGEVRRSPFADRDPKTFPGMIRFDGATLGGVSLDGAYIYPLQPARRRWRPCELRSSPRPAPQ